MSGYTEEDEVDYSDSSLTEDEVVTSQTAQGAEKPIKPENTLKVEDEPNNATSNDEPSNSGADVVSSSSFSDSSEDEEDEEDEEVENGNVEEDDVDEDEVESEGEGEAEFSPKTWKRLQDEADRGYRYRERPRSKYEGFTRDEDPALSLEPDVTHPLHSSYKPYGRGIGPERQPNRMGEAAMPAFPDLPRSPSPLGQHDQALSDNKKRIVNLVVKQTLTPKRQNPVQQRSPTSQDGCDSESSRPSSPIPDRPSSVPHNREDDPTTPGSPITDEGDRYEGPPDSAGPATVIPWEVMAKSTGQKADWADEDENEDWLFGLNSPVAPSPTGSPQVLGGGLNDRQRDQEASEYEKDLQDPEDPVEGEEASEQSMSPAKPLRHGVAEESSLEELRQSRTPRHHPAEAQQVLDHFRLPLVYDLELQLLAAQDKLRQAEEDRRVHEHQDGQVRDYMIGLDEEIAHLEIKLEKAEKTSKKWKDYAELIDPLAEAERRRQETTSADATTQTEPQETQMPLSQCVAKCANYKAIKDENESLKDERNAMAAEAERLRGEVTQLQESLQQAAQLGLQAAQQVQSQAKLLGSKPDRENFFHHVSASSEPSPALPSTADLPSAGAVEKSGKPAWQVRMEQWRKTPEFVARCEALEAQANAQKLARRQEQETERADRNLRLDVYSLITGDKAFEYVPHVERNLMLEEMRDRLVRENTVRG